MYAMCLAHLSDQRGFSCTRPGIPFAVRCEFSAARMASGAAPLPAEAAPAAASASATRLSRIVRMGAYLIGPRRRRLYSPIRSAVEIGERARPVPVAAFRVKRPDQRGPRRFHCHGRVRACSLGYSGTAALPAWTLESLG